jgi:hypothetical protein
LLDVLDNPGRYQPSARSLAKAEFEARQLSSDDVNEARQLLKLKNEKKEKQQEQVDTVRSKLTGAGNEMYETFSPIRSSIPMHEKLIRLVAIAFSLFYLYKLISGFPYILAILKGESYGSFDYTGYLFPLLVEGAAIVFFWLRKRIGWILLVAFCSYSMIAVALGLFNSIYRQLQGGGYFDFFPTPSPVAYIVAGLFFIGTIFVLKKDDVRDVFRIQKNDLTGSVVSGVLMGLLFVVLALY